MTTKNIFAFTANTHPYPEFISINDVGGDIKITVRGPKKEPSPEIPYENTGNTVDMVLPRDKIPELVQSLLKISPLKQLDDALPLVLYFDNEADRRQFMDIFQSLRPGMKAINL